MPSESTPLLDALHLGSRPARIHWLDNLRTCLTILLIFHHTTMEVVQASIVRGYFGSTPKPESVFLSIFLAINKTFLWGLFFFVSGYSTRLAIEEKEYDYKVFASRLLKIGVPAILWIWFARDLLVICLRKIGLKNVFDLQNDYVVTTRMVGPVGYVFGLLFLDAVFLLSRWIGRHFKWLDISSLSKRFASGKRGFIVTALLSIDVVLIFTFLSCLGIHLYIGHFYRAFSYDIRVYPNSHATYIISYITGVSFPFIKQYLLFDLRHSITSMVNAELLAYLSMGVCQDLMPALGKSMQLRDIEYEGPIFFDPGFNLHTAFYVFWTAFVFYMLSLSTLSVFSQTPLMKKDWGMWTRHTYPQTYIHILPITLVLHFLPSTGALSDLILQILLAGTIALFVSWIAVLLPIFALRLLRMRG
ncbi:hypothetical protein CVT26_012714 [Gymnopilus dilepis]|uniref:Acyltransferase 3 domain-containing protein n=1 Tax=Gymnopilus dilepis TaxID=231916 RepID=A0A409YPG5_9AGAR|nr:hypothetical protein CVT26_012714 [Gymnopilus dilepis]